jgi:SAM-dependent methyltransferase
MSSEQLGKNAPYWNSEAARRPALYRELERDPYATAFTYGRHKLHVILERILRELGNAARVLDVGCGTGDQLRICRDLRLSVVGVEPSSSLRGVAQQLNPEVPVIDGTIMSLPFEDESFDFAYSIEVLRYFAAADRLGAYREVLRVLKPGSRFVFTMANRYALDGFSVYSGVRSLACRLRGLAAPPETYFVTPGQVRRELRGLRVLDVAFFGCVFGPVRIAYRTVRPWAARIASVLEPIDDALFKMPWAFPLAGHLVVVVTRPGRLRHELLPQGQSATLA